MNIKPITPEEFRTRRFTTAVFAGGGNRCWWQAGLVEAISSMACWQVNHVIGVSAGAGIAAAFVTGKTRHALEVSATRFENTPHNTEWLGKLCITRVNPDSESAQEPL